jgi:hypothetical protein
MTASEAMRVFMFGSPDPSPGRVDLSRIRRPRRA